MSNTATEAAVLDQIWDCMRSLESCRSGLHLSDSKSTEDIRIDPSHACDARCDLRELGNDTFVCAHSRNTHFCGANCTHAVENREELVCKITGRCVGVVYGVSFGCGRRESDLPTAYSTDGFEIVRTKKIELVACKPKSRKALDNAKVSKVLKQDMLGVAEQTIVALLWSDERERWCDEVRTRRSKFAHKRMSAYIRQRLRQDLPIVLTEVQNTFVTEMHRMDGWICKPPPVNEERLKYLKSQCVRIHLLMFCLTVRAKIHSPIFQLSQRYQLQYFTLAYLYIMRDGIRDDDGKNIVDRDFFLNKYLPNLNGLQKFGYKKSRFTHATACIKMAISLQKKLQFKVE
ncbi:hypothetical protein CYMTET_47308 [Cymbomonas tetramitiformis]|uniref:Uncharacterized protein n=1 Tax=Cymbomonas tetramitiformis TaxID=36881 RepID=A0AAE0EWQ7_9CHLO|nr:hypothetical protein CYMTET_47308 [Cymbomonas tetramitiformis]